MTHHESYKNRRLSSQCGLWHRAAAERGRGQWPVGLAQASGQRGRIIWFVKRALWLSTSVAIAAVTAAVYAQTRPDSGASQARKTVDTYCVGCHNSKAKAGGVALDTVSLDAVHEHADVWE